MAPKTPSRGGPASPRDPDTAHPARRQVRVAAPGTPKPSKAAPVPAEPASPRLVVALVRGFRGLRGQVRVELLTDRPEDRFTVGARLYLEGTSERLTIAEAMAVADGKGWWLRFREIGIREVAEERLRDRYLEIDAPNEPREPGRWFFHELQGLAVTSTTGEALGEITEIYRAGGAEVFVVRGPRGEFDVPAVQAIVTELAPDKGIMVVDLENLALGARPVEDEDYVRPRDRRPKKQPKKKPATPTAATGEPLKAGATGRPAKPRASADRPRRPKGSDGSTAATSTPADDHAPEPTDAPAPDA